MIRLVLAEDQSLLRGALEALLSLENDFQILATAQDGQTALRYIQKHEPDILVTDIEMPSLSGIELAEHMARHKLSTRVVIITTFGKIGYVERAKKAGVCAYLLKDAPSDDLVAAIRKVSTGGTYYDPTLLRYENFAQDPLSDRDRRILRLVEQGMTNKEIGEALNLKPGTVRNYLSEALEKLEVSNRIEGFRRARENGWL